MWWLIKVCASFQSPSVAVNWYCWFPFHLNMSIHSMFCAVTAVFCVPFHSLSIRELASWKGGIATTTSTTMMDIQERILELAMYITRFAVNQWDNETPSSTPDSIFFYVSNRIHRAQSWTSSHPERLGYKSEVSLPDSLTRCSLLKVFSYVWVTKLWLAINRMLDQDQHDLIILPSPISVEAEDEEDCGIHAVKSSLRIMIINSSNVIYYPHLITFKNMAWLNIDKLKLACH